MRRRFSVGKAAYACACTVPMTTGISVRAPGMELGVDAMTAAWHHQIQLSLTPTN